MINLNTTLLREKFIIRETDPSSVRSSPLIALGNRLTLPIKFGTQTETIIVRAQNMHSTLRFAAMLLQNIAKSGLITNRSPAFEYDRLWKEAQPLFERQHNKDSWVAIYHNGRPVYTQGEHHPFLDIIEGCDAKNRDEYDRAVQIAEDTFKQTGRAVNIDHHTNIAAVIGAVDSKIRIGLILRKPGRSATFNFTTDNAKKDSDIAPALSHAANWLELIQLSVTAGFHKSKRGDAIARSAPLPVVQARMGELNAAIGRYEHAYHPSYRPDRPDMMGLIEDTAFYARHGKQPN